MEKKHFSEEQIAFVLRQAESGTSVAEIIRKLGGSVNDPQLSHKHWYKNWGGVRHVESVAVATRHTLDEIDLEAATAETNRPGRCEPLPLDILPHFEAGFGSLPDQHSASAIDTNTTASASAVVRGSPTTITARPPTTRYRVPRSSRKAKAKRQKSSNSLCATGTPASTTGVPRFDPQSDCEAAGLVVVWKHRQAHDLGGQERFPHRDRLLGCHSPQ